MDFKKKFSGVTYDIGDEGRNNLAQTQRSSKLTEAIERMTIFKGKIDVPDDASRKEKKNIRRLNTELSLENSKQLKEYIQENRAIVLKAAKDYMKFQVDEYVDNQKRDIVNKTLKTVKTEVALMIAESRKENDRNTLLAFQEYDKQKQLYEDYYNQATSESTREVCLYILGYLDTQLIEYLESEKISNDNYTEKLREKMRQFQERLLTKF